MSNLKYSGLESRRFGKEIFRGNVAALDIEEFRKFYQENDPDILIVRLPVSEQHKLFLLNELGKDVIVADTLVYYDVELARTTYREVKNKDLSFEKAGSVHRAVFSKIIPEIFYNYTTHYFSNPLLERQKITEGYTEWAIGLAENHGNLCILAYADGRPVGFIACSSDGRVTEIILNGVLPAYQGRGIYTDLLRYVKDYYHRMGVAAIKVSTQVQNFTVQKAWNREGFVLNSAFVTVHLNKRLKG